jgi:hypothetical protein
LHNRGFAVSIKQGQNGRASCIELESVRSCFSTVLCAFLSVSDGARARGLTNDQQLAHDIYKELVEIDTTTATGDTGQAAEAMAARLKAAGFPNEERQ